MHRTPEDWFCVGSDTAKDRVGRARLRQRRRGCKNAKPGHPDGPNSNSGRVARPGQPDCALLPEGHPCRQPSVRLADRRPASRRH